MEKLMNLIMQKPLGYKQWASFTKQIEALGLDVDQNNNALIYFGKLKQMPLSLRQKIKSIMKKYNLRPKGWWVEDIETQPITGKQAGNPMTILQIK